MKYVKLGEYVELVSERNKADICNKVCSVTNSRGFVPSKDFFSKEVFSKELKNYKIVRRGMLAYNPSRINVGSIAVQDFDEKVVVSPLYVVFRAKNELDPDYLVRFLKSDSGKNQIRFRSSGTVRNNLKFDALSLIDCPLYSLPLQRKIVATLSILEDQINRANSFIVHLDNICKSRFVEMFGGVEQTRKLEELIAPDTRISYGIVQPGPEGTGDMGVLRPVDIVDGRIRLDDVKRIERSIGDSYRRTELTGDEILTVVRGATGQTVRSNADCATMNVTRGIAVIRYEPTLINPDYLVGYMNSDDGYRYITDHTQGATLQQINIADLKVMPIPIPSMGLQQKFADFVHQVDKLKFETQQSIEKLQMLYDSLAQEYFAPEGD